MNALLNAEADRLCNAQRYERSEARRDTRAGHYERNLQTKAGEVRLRIPKLRPDLRDRDHRAVPPARELGRGSALEMYLAGVSVRRVEDITEALWGTPVSPSTVSELSKKIYGTIEAWRNRSIDRRAIFEHRAAEGPADERCHLRLSQRRAPLCPN